MTQTRQALQKTKVNTASTFHEAQEKKRKKMKKNKAYLITKVSLNLKVDPIDKNRHTTGKKKINGVWVK